MLRVHVGKCLCSTCASRPIRHTVQRAMWWLVACGPSTLCARAHRTHVFHSISTLTHNTAQHLVAVVVCHHEIMSLCMLPSFVGRCHDALPLIPTPVSPPWPVAVLAASARFRHSNRALYGSTLAPATASTMAHASRKAGADSSNRGVIICDDAKSPVTANNARMAPTPSCNRESSGSRPDRASVREASLAVGAFSSCSVGYNLGTWWWG